MSEIVGRRPALTVFHLIQIMLHDRGSTRTLPSHLCMSAVCLIGFQARDTVMSQAFAVVEVAAQLPFASS